MHGATPPSSMSPELAGATVPGARGGSCPTPRTAGTGEVVVEARAGERAPDGVLGGGRDGVGGRGGPSPGPHSPACTATLPMVPCRTGPSEGLPTAWGTGADPSGGDAGGAGAGTRGGGGHGASKAGSGPRPGEWDPGGAGGGMEGGGGGGRDTPLSSSPEPPCATPTDMVTLEPSVLPAPIPAPTPTTPTTVTRPCPGRPCKAVVAMAPTPPTGTSAPVLVGPVAWVLPGAGRGAERGPASVPWATATPLPGDGMAGAAPKAARAVWTAATARGLPAAAGEEAGLPT